jgi:sugar fermentation stimulation protein A
VIRFDPPLLRGRLVRRYKRFLAEVQLDDGRLVTSHCPNTGAMTGCQTPGSRVWLQPSNNPRRKLATTWELVEAGDGNLVCIHSARANGVFEQALLDGLVPGMSGFDKLQREVRFGSEKSRADFMLEFAGMACFIEVKSVTLADGRGMGLFPDAVSERASRHLRELMAVKREGARAVLCFVVMHNGIEQVCPADQVDPHYGATLRAAKAQGVELMACRARVCESQIAITGTLPVVVPEV